MSLKGNFKTFDLTTIFQLLLTEKKTGILQVEDEDKDVRVYIKGGDVAYATNPQADNRLGSALKNNNAITDEQLAKCLMLCRNSKQALPKILADQAFVPAEKLHKFVQAQTEDIVFDLFFWEKGDFEYKNVELDPSQMFLVKLNTMQILLEGSRRVDEMQTLEKLIPNEDLIFRESEGIKTEAVEGLAERDLYIFSLMNGTYSVRQLIDETGYDKYTVYKILNSLFDSGLVKQFGEAGKRPELAKSKVPPHKPDRTGWNPSSLGSSALTKIVKRGVPENARSYQSRFYGSLVGKQLDNYWIIQFIGAGGVGGVFQGWDVDQEREVALKVISYELSSQAAFCDKFIREARVISELDHPNIVQIYDVRSSNDILYYAMEFITGDTLSVLIQKYRTLNTLKGVDYLITICKALDFASKKHTIHWDIVPENIIISNKGIVKIVDFRAAETNDADDLGKQQNAFMNSPFYVSPEFLASRPLDHRSHIYSLGATFYHAFTGHPPFEGVSIQDILDQHLNRALTPLREKNSKVPNVLGQVIEKMMHKNPQSRYQDYQSIINDLEALRLQAVNKIRNRS